VPKQEIDDRVRKAAAILEIEPNLDREPGQLSGGQRQQVAM
jgi:multiple sugar transport system ATP-binding protein